MSNSNVTQLVPTRPDAVVAEEYRKRMIEALGPVIAICDEARRDGFQILFNLGFDATGRHMIAQLDLIKKY